MTVIKDKCEGFMRDITFNEIASYVHRKGRDRNHLEYRVQPLSIIIPPTQQPLHPVIVKLVNGRPVGSVIPAAGHAPLKYKAQQFNYFVCSKNSAAVFSPPSRVVGNAAKTGIVILAVISGLRRLYTILLYGEISVKFVKFSKLR
jgi:hypothetical protein